MASFRIACLRPALLLGAALLQLVSAPSSAIAITNLAHPSAGPRRPASVPDNYVITPFGYFHPSCVQTLAKGEQLLADGRIQRADGTASSHAAVCGYTRFSHSGEILSAPASQGQHTAQSPEINGWVETAEVTTNDPNIAYGAILAAWTVPPQPERNDEQVLYFFPGLEDINNVQSILQPVLGWFYGQWTINSWNCCLNGVATNSGLVNVSPGDHIYGSVTSTCPAGTVTCATWNVLTVDLDTGQSTTLANTPSDGQSFNWAFGGVLEAYYIDTCKDYPRDHSLRFDYVNLFDENLKVIPHPEWGVYLDSQDTPQCHYGVKSTAHTVTVDY